MSLWAQPALNRLEPMRWFVVPSEDGAKAAACRLGADRCRRCLFDLSAGALCATECRINPGTRFPRKMIAWRNTSLHPAEKTVGRRSPSRALLRRPSAAYLRPKPDHNDKRCDRQGECAEREELNRFCRHAALHLTLPMFRMPPPNWVIWRLRKRSFRSRGL